MSTKRPPALPVSSDGFSREAIPGKIVAFLSAFVAAFCFYMMWSVSDYRGARLFNVGDCGITAEAESWEEPNLTIYKIVGLGEKAYKVNVRFATGDVLKNQKMPYEIARFYRKASCPKGLESK